LQENDSHHSYPAVRQYALESLGELGATDQVPKISPLLGDPRNAVCTRALWPLRNLGTQDVARQALPFLSGGSTRRSVFAWGALEGAGGKEEVNSVLRLMDSSNGLRSKEAIPL
jgi:hypothetical protein